MSRPFVVGLLLAPATAQSTGLLTLFLPDSEPLSLDASVVGVSTAGTDPVTTLRVACPTGSSPENNACRTAGIYPAQVYHTRGSVWGGTTTYSADDSTTTWICTLGGSHPTLSGDCTKTIVASDSTRTMTATYGNCYVGAHQRPIVVTAGLEKIDSFITTIDASELVSIQQSLLSEDGCPSSKTTIWEGAVTRATSTTTMGGGSHGEAHQTTLTSTGGSGESTAAPTHTDTDTVQASTTSPNTAVRRGQSPMGMVLLGMGVVLMIGSML
ncbi:hypothetical protein C7999DRAFT_42548 [Corynascus novoguineensis]|uniref:Uncharacterized protein n=1 Tax=Corynascus novoguineensis TaxID=1126955 RepID=A0AAN7CPI6_9PEZI|nr:hypothetical protein C7999DRAFT_42548 [Corynascus novoguineensis]